MRRASCSVSRSNCSASWVIATTVPASQSSSYWPWIWMAALLWLLREFEHHVLGEHPPAPAPATLDCLADQRGRQQYDDRAGGEPGEQRVVAPELAREPVGHDASDQGASRATAATARVSRRYDPAEFGRLGPGT
jgi:hypothetical protein